MLFCICVAGKTASTTSKRLNNFLRKARKDSNLKYGSPFSCLRHYSEDEIKERLLASGIGCQTMKGKCIYQIVNSKTNLKTCTEDDLVSFHGIKYKTANLFLMHNRENYKGACLDVHILKHINYLGYKTPAQSPSSKKTYKKISRVFFTLCEQYDMMPAELDLKLWRRYANNKAQRRKTSNT